MVRDGHIVSLRLDEKEHERLVDGCNKKNISKSDFIRKAIRDKLNMEFPEGNSKVIMLEIPSYYMEIINGILIKGAAKSIDEYIRFLIMSHSENRLNQLPAQKLGVRDARCER